jgi:superfamily I DNA/RNA helicase/RecB family exonuclease
MLDRDQTLAVEHAKDSGHLLVLGAPGSGKTTTAMAVMERRLAEAVPGSDVLMLVPTRQAAERVRDALTSRITRTVGHVLVRTPASLAFSVLRARAAALGDPPPALVTGPEQDAILAELLAGHAEGAGASPPWPPHVPESARSLRAFRAELRDLLMRAAEAGLSPAGLASLGRRRRREEWVAASAVMREYEQVLRLGRLTPDRGERYDAALIVDEAVAALRSWSRVVPRTPQPRFRAVVVDDYQDCTFATARLLRVLADDGAQVFLFGDPDAAVHTFRGGTPSLLASATAGREQQGGFSASVVVLGTVWRQHPALRRATVAVTARIAATAGVAHRRAGSGWATDGEPGQGDPGQGGPADGAPTGVEVAVLSTAAEEAAVIARVLREEHLHHGTDYADMAVVVRSGAQVTTLRRRLAAAGVPVEAAAGESALKDAPAVAPLLLALDVALGRPWDAETAVALLTSPLAGADRLDAVSVRTLRRVLRAREATGQGRSFDEALIEAVNDEEAAAALRASVGRGPARIAAVVKAVREAAMDPDASTERLLWAAWSTAGLADSWRRTALAGGPAGERADRDLDAVLELFRAAEHFGERHPGASAREFVRLLQSQDLRGDSIAPRGLRRHAVPVLTAAASSGVEWAVVAVAGLQEDVWPDLRLRGSLLGAQDLADVVAGRGSLPPADPHEARRDVLQDELRAFAVAVSRARRRLVLTAVRAADSAPSPFLDLAQPAPGQDGARAVTTAPAPLDLRGLVATLRRELPDGPDAGAAAELLAELAARGVPGADPQEWSWALPESTRTPLWAAEETVELSPSSLETAQRCALRWALERVGGRAPSRTEQSVGTLVHAIAAEHPHGSHEELSAELERRWPELALGEGWVAERQRAAAEEMIRRLAGYLASRPGLVDVECQVEARVGQALLRGRIDRLEHGPDGAVRVVDLKTGSSAKSAAQAATDSQLAAYQAAIRAGALGPDVRPGGGALVYLGVNKEAAQRHQPPLDDGSAEEIVAAVARMAAAASFPATVGDGCRSCPVLSSCPARLDGVRAPR